MHPDSNQPAGLYETAMTLESEYPRGIAIENICSDQSQIKLVCTL